jgi:hypothetical protein
MHSFFLLRWMPTCRRCVCDSRMSTMLGGQARAVQPAGKVAALGGSPWLLLECCSHALRCGCGSRVAVLPCSALFVSAEDSPSSCVPPSLLSVKTSGVESRSGWLMAPEIWMAGPTGGSTETAMRLQRPLCPWRATPSYTSTNRLSVFLCPAHVFYHPSLSSQQPSGPASAAARWS